MDVTKTLATSNDLNGARRLQPSPQSSLNHAKQSAAGKPIDPFMGVTHPRTIENAKRSDLSINAARDVFAKALEDAASSRKPLDSAQAEKLQKSSETLVNQFFMGSMLKQMRQSPFKNDMFTGGKGGDAYAGLFDQQIAEHAGNRIAKSLVKSMVKQYTRGAAPVPAGMSA